jgi:hypothetical protein
MMEALLIVALDLIMGGLSAPVQVVVVSLIRIARSPRN